MVTLKCGVVSCVYNADNLCKKSNIMVEGNHAETQAGTFCASFEERKAGNMQNKTETPNPNAIVDCQAHNCIYNENRVCHAAAIDISGTHAATSQETECGTFRCKSNC